MFNNPPSTTDNWPELDYSSWKDTLATVQLWTQIVGKIRLRNMPWLNHSWHVTLYVSPVGFTTGSIPYDRGIFEIEFNFHEHRLYITSSDGSRAYVGLYPRTVADFYRELFEKLESMDLQTDIYARPNELDPAIPFADDDEHQSYDGEKIKKFWQATVNIQNVFNRFRARFKGKCSPVHLFWGAFDLAVTRFSGKEAPLHPGVGMPNMPARVMQEAYSHEVSSCGFWPGNDAYPHAAFYSYCYPASPDFGKQAASPKEAFYSEEMGEFLLPYESVRNAENPEETLMQFCSSTYEAAANTGNWERDALECDFSSFEK